MTTSFAQPQSSASVARRRFLLPEETVLLLADSVTHQVIRLRQFCEASGLAREDVFISPMCAMPLPLYRFAKNDPGARRWAGTNATFMWHPLMWLPNRLAGRITYRDAELDADVRESDEVWAIRLSLELFAAGLYDPETGGWLDVLAAHGIDSTDEMDQYRIQDWLDGEPDEQLDAIDLSVYLNDEDPYWALSDALELQPILREASWALVADELAGQTSSLSDPSATLSHEDRLDIMRSVCLTAMNLFTEAPLANDEGEPTTPSPTEEGHSQFFMRAHAAITPENAQVPEATLAAVAEAVGNRCIALREGFWSSLEALHAGPEDDTQVQASHEEPAGS